ncbi:MAG: hypothetical protein Q9218_007399 [Villophora microphyllina]
MIYKLVIVGNSEHRHIVELKRTAANGKRQKNRLWGASCTDETGTNCKIPITYSEPLPELQRVGGALGLARTCRQVYVESINTFYEPQIFRFKVGQRPPYFLRATLPQRLARIRHIHLLYIYPEQCYPHPQPMETNLSLKHIKVCADCGFCYWLDAIQKSLLGLQTIAVTIASTEEARLSMRTARGLIDDAWVPRLLALRERLKVKVAVDTKMIYADGSENAGRGGTFVARYTRELQLFEARFKEKLEGRREPFDAVIDIPNA